MKLFLFILLTLNTLTANALRTIDTDAIRLSDRSKTYTFSNTAGVFPTTASISGDATMAVSGDLTLKTVAAAGSYAQVTVNAKGLVTAGSVSQDLSSGVTGVLPLANGGTNKNATASNGAVAYSDADSLEFTSVGSSGQFLKSAGAASPVWQTFSPPTVQIFTTGTGTYTTPANVIRIEVEMVGGGGAGGANGSGPSDGTNGASTVFGSATSGPGLLSSSGGGNPGGTGGTNTLAYTTINSFDGNKGAPGGYDTDEPGSSGAGSYYGGAGAGGARGAAGTTPGIDGVVNTGAGGGGAGGNGTYASGGGGGSGAYQQFYISGPAATYSYTVGAGGTLGGAGGGGNNSGAGAAGKIIVREYYQ